MPETGRATRRVPETERSLLATLLRADFLQVAGARRFLGPIDTDGPRRGCGVDDCATLAPVDEILRVGDHGGEIAVHRAAVVRHVLVVVVRLGLALPVRAVRDARKRAADD